MQRYYKERVFCKDFIEFDSKMAYLFLILGLTASVSGMKVYFFEKICPKDLRMSDYFSNFAGTNQAKYD